MRIAIVCANEGWHVRDLVRAGSDRGAHVEVVPFDRLIGVLGATMTTRAGNFDLADADAVIVRTMPRGTLEQVILRMDVLRVIEARGVPVINSGRALETAIDKFLSLARIRSAGLSVPRTTTCESMDDAACAAADLGPQVVIKPLFGSEGGGVEFTDDVRSARSAFERSLSEYGVIYLQEAIESPGWDARALVVGGRVVAAMRRFASPGTRLTNVAKGGRAEAYDLPPEAEQLAVESAAAVGTDVAGVDVIQGRDERWYVLEVNAVPGWRALAGACGRDIARSIIEYVADQSTTPQPVVAP